MTKAPLEAPGDARTGADDLVATLVDGGIDLCLANPGTSEMHFVAALDRSDGMRCVLALFEGVATGAADGYYRMIRRPAASPRGIGVMTGPKKATRSPSGPRVWMTGVPTSIPTAFMPA